MLDNPVRTYFRQSGEDDNPVGQDDNPVRTTIRIALTGYCMGPGRDPGPGPKLQGPGPGPGRNFDSSREGWLGGGWVRIFDTSNIFIAMSQFVVLFCFL